MGYASYLEDIDSKATAIGEIVLEYSKLNSNEGSNRPESLKDQNKRLQDGMDKLKNEIEALHLIIQQVKKDKAEQNFLLRKEKGKSDSLAKKIDFESDLRREQEKTGNNLSELNLDLKQYFQDMIEITNQMHGIKTELNVSR